MNLSVLIHTFNKYSFLWPGQHLAFCTHWRDEAPVFFGTDIEGCEATRQYGKMIYSGPGEWSDRLMRLLEKIPTDYVLYMQEDHWPKASPPDLTQMLGIMKTFDLNRLQISPVNQFYSLHGSEIPLFFHQTSKYLVSHQPSIWKKSFLLECLKPNETPWQNEYAGTMRLNVRADIREKIAIYPCDWYKHMCIKGKMVEV
jgi:hypothetical protein